MNDYYDKIFSRKILDKIFSKDRMDSFFTALLGDSTEGAYEISLSYLNCSENRLEFEFRLKQRAGKMPEL